MGYPAAISVVWHASDQIAIRPEITFAASSSSTTALGLDLESDQFSVSPGVSALFYLAKWDAVRTYVSPKYSYQHISTSSTGPLASVESTASAHSIAGSVGAEFAAHRRFAVFGEVGLLYSRLSAEAGSLEGPTANNWGVRSGVGVIFYFK